MQPTMWRRGLDTTRSVYERLNLTIAGLAAVVAGLLVLGATAVVFGGVTEDVTRHNGLSTTDVLHLHWFTEHRTDTLVSASRMVSEIGSPVVLGLAAAAAAVWLWMRGLRLGLAVAPGAALAIAAVSAEALKLLVGRHRPPLPLHLVAENNASFPSGHATDSAAFFVALSLVVAVFVFRRTVARAAVILASGLLAASVGISRLILGVHWPTDVLAGWALGLAAAVIVTIVASILAIANRSSDRPRPVPIAIVLRLFDVRRHGGTRLQSV
jgi:membrane-associated phospholipid phosphatase